MRSPTEQGDPSPIGLLMPAPAKPIPLGPPIPKVGAVGAVAEQGGGSQYVPPPESVPLRSSLLFSPQENGPQQRSDVPADQGATGNVGFVPVTGQSGEDQGVSALMERDAVIAELRRQVRVLHAQNNVQTYVQNDAQNHVQNNFSSQTRPGVIPNRGQTGLQSKAPPEGTQDGVPEAARAKYPRFSEPSPLEELKDSPAYSEPDKAIWEQSYLSKALQQMKDSEMTK